MIFLMFPIQCITTVVMPFMGHIGIAALVLPSVMGVSMLQLITLDGYLTGLRSERQ